MAASRHDSNSPTPTPSVHKYSPKILTVESVNHLHRLVSRVLEEQTGFRDADKDAWVSGIESALNDLARAVEAGAWLSGIRGAKAAERKRAERAAAEARKREQESIVAKQKETDARNKTKSRAPTTSDSARSAKDADADAPEVKTETPHAHKPPSDDTSRNLRALQQLRKLANTRRTSSPDDPKHARYLLLTVAPPDAAPSRPSSLNNTPAPRCFFTSGVYSLPAPDLFGEDPDDNCEAVVNSTLYGFREWDGACYFPLNVGYQLTSHKWSHWRLTTTWNSLAAHFR